MCLIECVNPLDGGVRTGAILPNLDVAGERPVDAGP
jgi:hypothetical protein